MNEEKDLNNPGHIILEKKVMELDARVSLMEKIIARIDGTLEQLEKRVSRIEEDLRSLRAEVKEDIRRLDERIDKLEERIDSNFKWTIAIMVGGFISTIAVTIVLKLLLG